VGNLNNDSFNLGNVGVGAAGVGGAGLNPITTIIPSGAIAYWNFTSLNTNANRLLDMVGESLTISTTRSDPATGIKDNVLAVYAANNIIELDESILIQRAGRTHTVDEFGTGWTTENITRDIANLTEAGIDFTKITETTANNVHRDFRNLTDTLISIGTHSVIFKRGDGIRFVGIQLFTSAADLRSIVIDLDTQTQVDSFQIGTTYISTNLEVEEIVADDIHRYTYSYEKTGNMGFQVVFMSDSASPTFLGAGVPFYQGDTDNHMFYAFAQSERSFSGSSLIDNRSGASSLRVLDAAIVPLSSFSKVNNFTFEFVWEFAEDVTTDFDVFDKASADTCSIGQVTNVPQLDVDKTTGASSLALSDWGNVAGRRFTFTYGQSSTAGVTLTVVEVGGSSYSDTDNVNDATAKLDTKAWGTNGSLAGLINGRLITVLFK